MAGAGDIVVWINSPGGDCVAAAQIYTMSDVLDKSTKEGARKIQKAAKKKAPKDTGRLRKSIKAKKMKKGGVGYFVKPYSYIAHFHALAAIVAIAGVSLPVLAVAAVIGAAFAVVMVATKELGELWFYTWESIKSKTATVGNAILGQLWEFASTALKYLAPILNFFGMPASWELVQAAGWTDIPLIELKF